MPTPEFEDLPFQERPDLTPYLIHLTKNTISEDEYSAFDNLLSILMGGIIWGSNSQKGFIKGPNKATCLMDVPFFSLKYILNKENTDPEQPRYEPFGIFIDKKSAYTLDCRPVLYLSNEEIQTIGIPREELWRVVRFEVNNNKWISWLHEREWRCKGDLHLSSMKVGVLVKNTKFAMRLQKMINNDRDSFKSVPLTILPLQVVCQGLNYM